MSPRGRPGSATWDEVFWLADDGPTGIVGAGKIGAVMQSPKTVPPFIHVISIDFFLVGLCSLLISPL